MTREVIYGEIYPEPEGNPEGFSNGSDYISLHILTQVRMHTVYISINDNSVLSDWEILNELIFCNTLAVESILYPY